jgi:glycosyltransferase involved in cell wall biosynthesis
MEIDCSLSTPFAETERTATKPEVSVIVPVYNVEPYLRRCINSLINQTLQNIEIILIDDGSTDGCGAICDEYAAQDARLRVVHQENAGLSEARNSGIDRARADYLMFVDSDDWVEPEFCEIPLMVAKERQSDLVMFQYKIFRNGREKKRRYFIENGVKTQAAALSLLLGGVGITAWNKLYHRDLFLANRYPKGMVYEDIVLTPVLIHEARRIVYVSAALYDRELHEGSITTNHSEENAHDWFHALTVTAQRLREWGYAAESEHFYQSSILSFIGGEWQNEALNRGCIQYIRSLKRCPLYFSLKQRFKYYLCVFSPSLYRFVCKVYRWLHL